MTLVRILPLALAVLLNLALFSHATVRPAAAFCEIVEPESAIPAQVNGTQVEIHLTEGFARVVIIKEFHNPSTRFKEGQIFFPLERGHELLTDLRLKIGNVVYNASARDRGEALDEFLKQVAQQEDAALLQYDAARDVYWIAVTIPPQESRTTIATLEMPLAKEDGFYRYGYRLSVDAGHSKFYLRLHVRIETSAPLRDASIPSHPSLAILRSGDRVAEAYVNETAEASGRDLELQFRASDASVSQFADPGTQDRYVRISVDSRDRAFAGSLRPLSRSFLILVDASGSMGHHDRWPLARGAVRELLGTLVPGDTVGVAVFQGRTVRSLAPSLRESDETTASRVDAFLGTFRAAGSTNLAVGLPLAESWAREARERGQQPLLFLVSDGRDTLADLPIELETSYKRVSYDQGLPMFALSIKPSAHADENLLRNLTHFNHGMAVSTFGDVPAGARALVETIRVPVLHDIRAVFSGVDGAELATPSPQAVREGGEAVVLGKMRGSGDDPVSVRLTWTDEAGGPRSFDLAYRGEEVPLQPLLKKAWVLTRIHAMLEVLRAREDPATRGALKDLATDNRVVTPYTSLLVTIPRARPPVGPAAATGDLFAEFGFGSGLASSRGVGGLLERGSTPLGYEARRAEALRQDLASPLLADNEVDRYVFASAPDADRLLGTGPPVRYRGESLIVLKVNGELVAVMRDWLDPANRPAILSWNAAWLGLAAIALWGFARVCGERKRADEVLGTPAHAPGRRPTRARERFVRREKL